MIPKSSLDDRTFDEIKDELIRLIPRYNPEWTNHNPSDPGITLIELFSYLTEITLYRLNKVPEKTYLSLLELIGMSLTPPQTARTVIRFFPVEGYGRPVRIRAGERIAASDDETDTIVFETEKEVTVSNAEIVSCVNRYGEKWSDFCTDGEIRPFLLFSTQNDVEHILYISSPAFRYLQGEHHIQISFEPESDITSAADEITKHLSWEYWDGRDWNRVETELSAAGARQQDNTVYISGPIEIQPCTVNGHEDVYLRAVLADIPEKLSSLSVKGITVRTIFGGAGFMPDLCMTCSGAQYAPADMNADFRLFSENPSYNEIFYISSDDIFSKTGTKLRIVFKFSEVYTGGHENDNAVFAYEYWNGADWCRISEHTPDFSDGTFGFKQSGDVTFTIPSDTAKAAVNGEDHFWIRIRLLTKDFSIGGNYVQDDSGNWIWTFTSSVQSPVIAKIRLSYEAKRQLPERACSSSNFSWINLDSLCRNGKKDSSSVRLFRIQQNTLPMLFLGFSSVLSEGSSSIYVKIREDSTDTVRPPLPSFFRKDDFFTGKGKRNADLSWEYWNGTEWHRLETADRTDCFHESGFIEFTVPSDMKMTELYGKNCSWIRVIQISGSFEKVPFVEGVFANCVYALNGTTFKNEILGSGTGGPGQMYDVAHKGILEGCVVSVDEGSVPSDNELILMKKDGIDKPYFKENDSVWVRYREVENFYASGPFSRHFVVDYHEGKILFGDGQHGVNPPRRKFNIRLEEYHTGGGERGNVAPHTLQVLTQSVPFIAGCDNPFAAEGGAEMEDIANLKARAAGVFKSRQRAVTCDDFQWLAREASASVGRAYCLGSKDKKGNVVTVIIPVMSRSLSYEVPLLPSRELIRRVKEYLDERKLVGTPIVVKGPVYRNFAVNLSLVFKSDVIDADVRRKSILNDLHRYFHALAGGEGTGWEFGKEVTKGSVLKLLEKEEGILSVDSLRIRDSDADVDVEKLILKEDELPLLGSVTLTARSVAS